MVRTIGIVMAVSIVGTPVSAQTVQIVQTPRAATAPRAPSGWVGITYTADGQTDADGNLMYSDYPVVASVDPGSPAAGAGLAAGDTIIAFNDRDLKRFALPLRSMIQPGKPFIIRYRRDKERTVKLIVAERPAERKEYVEITMQPMIPAGPPSPFVLTPGPMRGVRVPMPVQRMILPIAGAEVRSLSVDLAKTLGLKPQGLFIVYVSEGSPAKEAGLRDGDVLLRAAEQNLLTPQDLQQILQSDINRSVRIDLIRQKKSQTVTLRW